MKIKHLEENCYLFGNKGAVWKKKVHIAQSGGIRTLCGIPMLSTNWAAFEGIQEPGCEECKRIYNELLKS